MKAGSSKRAIYAWAFYDWANSAYAVTVITMFFPYFFREYWVENLTSGQITKQIGLANSLASLAVVVLAPVLGAIADRGGSKKKFLLLFTSLGIVMTAGLYMVEKGDWMLAVWLYVVATIGFSGGVSFSDSLLVHVAEKSRLDRVSALGYALGYLGGGLIFAVCVWLTLSPGKFGFLDAGQAVRFSFLLVSAWWAIFAIPVFLFVKEPEVRSRMSGVAAMKGGLVQLYRTFQEIRKLRVVFVFLLGYWLYIDGVDTIVRMAVDYGLALGFDTTNLTIAILITQFVGFPAAIAFGVLGEKIGPKTAIQIAIGVYMLVVFWAYSMHKVWEFYVLAIIIGLVQGGIQSLSRSLYGRIIPASKSAEFYGFYNTLGKFAAVLGPVMIGWVTVLTGSHRLAMLSILVLFVAGAILLRTVNVEDGEKMARELEKI